MIATVTGIAPFVAMLRDVFHREQRRARFIVLQGASHQDEFGYAAELQRMNAAHPEVLTYVPVVSRPESERNYGWSGPVGRVHTFVEILIDRFRLAPCATAAYACGHPGMIEEVKKRLAPRGFPIREERYWKE
jgi:NAD(P)H-flavin reductase